MGNSTSSYNKPKKKKGCLIFFLFIIIFIAGIYILFKIDIPTPSEHSGEKVFHVYGKLDASQSEHAKTLFANSNERIELLTSNGVIRSVMQKYSCEHCNKPQDHINYYFDQYQGLYQIDDFSMEFELETNHSFPNGKAIRYHQHFNGIPVYASSMVVSFDRFDNIISTGGNYITRANKPIERQAKMSAQDLNKAIEALGYEAIGRNPAKLFYFNAQLLEDKSAETTLAWEVEVQSESDAMRVLISDETGEELNAFSMLEEAAYFRVLDFGKRKFSNKSFCDKLSSSTNLYDSLGPMTSTDSQLQKLSELINQSMLAYEARFGWNNFNNKDNYLIIVRNVDYDSPATTDSCGSPVVFFILDNVYSSDIFTHEYQHRVTGSKVFLPYSKKYTEGGAVNEAYSDIFTLLTTPEEDLWQVMYGSDLIRDMQNPSTNKKPNHYSKLKKRNIFDLSSKTSKYGYPHFNSTIISHAAYLLAEGGEAYGVSVEGIGIDPMLDIFFASLDHLPNHANFLQTRNKVHSACQTIYGEDTEICDQVLNAFAAVGVGIPAVPKPKAVNLPNLRDQLAGKIIDWRESILRKLNKHLENMGMKIEDFANRMRQDAEKLLLEMLTKWIEAWINLFLKETSKLCGGTIIVTLFPIFILLFGKKFIKF